MLPYISLHYSSVSRASLRSSRGRTPVKHPSTPSRKPWHQRRFSITPFLGPLWPSPRTQANWPWAVSSSNVAGTVGNHSDSGVPSSSHTSSSGRHSTGNCLLPSERFVIFGPWWRDAPSLYSPTICLSFLPWQRRLTPRLPGKSTSCLLFPSLRPTFGTLRARQMWWQMPCQGLLLSQR